MSSWALLRGVIGLLALPVGAAAAAALWMGGAGARTAAAAALLAAAIGTRLLPLGLARDAIYAATLVALPTLAALRRCSPDVMAEATMAGAGPLARAWLLCRLAAPGLAAGAVLWVVAPQLGLPATLLIATLPLVLRG